MAFLIVVLSASFFTWALPHIEAFRVAHAELIFGMPLLIIFIWWDRKKTADVLSSRDEVAALKKENAESRPVHIAAGLKQIGMTLAAHAVGASVGREAVGIQLGGWAARLRDTKGWYFAACVGAGFAIILGTPFAAMIFIFESKRWRLSWTEWLGVPVLVWLAYKASLLLGVEHVEPPQFVETLVEFNSLNLLRLGSFAAILTAVSLVLGGLFLALNSWLSKFRGTRVKDLFLPFAFLVAVAVTFYVADFEYVEALGLPGLGVTGLRGLWDFDLASVTFFTQPLSIAILKILLTAIFVGIGVRGGELTPMLVAGGMAAAGLALLMELPIAPVVAIGFPLVWGIPARRPLTAAVLAVEIFGTAPFGVLGVVVLLAAFIGLKLGDLLMKQAFWRRGLYDDVA